MFLQDSFRDRAQQAGEREDYAEAGSHWCRQLAQDATRLAPETDEWGRAASPHAGQGPGRSGSQGLLHPQENPLGPLSRTGTIG